MTPEQIIALQGLGGLAIVVALVQILIKPFLMDARLWPVAAIVLGVGWNLFLAYVLGTGDSWGYAVILGLLTGLAASGAYSTQSTLRGQ